MRAFAKSLGISASILSSVLNEKRHLSSLNLLRISQAMNWSKDTAIIYLNELKSADSSRLTRPKERFTEHEDYELLANWYFLAVYHLAKLPRNKADPKWISARIGITPAQARKAVRLLVTKKLLSIRHGQLFQIGNPMLFVEHPPSQKMIQAKETVFKRGMKAFRSVPGEKQLALTGHLPVHPKDLPLLGQLVWKMYRKMTRVSQDPQSLYYLTVQVFPVHSGIES